MKIISSIALISSVLFTACNGGEKNEQKIVRPVPAKKKPVVPERAQPAAAISYRLVPAKKWIRQHRADTIVQHSIAAINRTDRKWLSNLDSILVPSDSAADRAFYFPFPLSFPLIKDVEKIIFFSYPAQAFAAYEWGNLVYTGPTNMGRKKDPTPTGLFYTNWKAEETTSTFNDEWNLRWNFNIINKLGVGWHQYEMPGYPASHSCLRLNEQDAQYLYTWADQWVLKNDTIQLTGTPVLVFGEYPFGARKPWLKLATDPHATDISVKDLQQIAAPHLNEILLQQEKRAQKLSEESLPL